MTRVERAVNVAAVVVPFLSVIGAGVLLWNRFFGGSFVAGDLSALLRGGLVRVFLVHHATSSVNSVCRSFGRRRFRTDDESTKVFWLALPTPTLSEAWHHNHYAFPRFAFHGLRWYELDPSGWFIRGRAAVGLAWDVVGVSPDSERLRLSDAGA
jgi:stearoyl-CoA desaturase (delta-9 desaturase)